jgi:hypothetical protein
VAALEKHYTVAEVASLWSVSEDTIRRLFRDRADVFKLATPDTKEKRGYCVLRIPESVVKAVHAKMRGVAA